MAFGIVRLYSSLEPQKLIDVTNEHLDKNNRKNAYIGRSITRPNMFILGSRYENLEEKEDQDNENRTAGLVSNIGGGEFRDVSLIKVVNSNSEGKGLNSNSYLALFGGENSNIRKTTELSEEIIKINEGSEAFHSDKAKQIIPEVLQLWTTKNRGIFKTVRNMG